MTEQQFDFEADTGKILNIVINSLYSQREIFLRELISNASDAINKRKFEALSAGEASDTIDGAIAIAVDKKAKTITVRDNGIGLSAEEMVETLGTIASSGTKAFIEAAGTVDDAKKPSKKGANGQHDISDQLIGQFGVGFYSAFMVADKIEVVSKRHGAKKSNVWTSDGQSGFSIAEGERDDTGTDVILYLRSEAKEFLEQERLSHLVKKYSDHIAQPISWIGKDGETEQMNSSTALWTRSPKDISDEEYTSFYQSVAYAYDAPFSTLHNKTEGTVEFTNLLFIPSAAPFDLFEPERKSKLHLYVNRVFITENCEDLVPKWMRFLRGIIDTPDVDLNVSREMLQQNPVVTKIRKAVVKRVLGEMKKALKNRRDEYQSLWMALGKVIKEGLYEDQDNKDKILEVSLFTSTKTNDLVTLAEYVENFAKGQEVIYYLSAENPELALKSPHLESFEAKGIDVLLLTDPIDDFWLNSTENFDGKSFQSITRGEIDLSKIGTDTKDEKEQEPPANDSLVAKIKLALGGDVLDVRSSANMEKSLARLVAGENAMDPQMERMMRMHNPDFKAGQKILEVNAKHPLIQSLNERLESGEFDGSENFARLLLDSARVAEGEAITDPREFTNRIADVMQQALGKNP
ncbi:molecular chaperone HtpG [Alphaproteobacteria bacterium]|jgi:molecular chaperone HtpG|nr:molecular chaperone HtpG [Alphaproteobacteria bacterium]